MHVKHDSGMGRLGTTDADLVRELCAKVEAHPRLELAGLMTHFATADEPGDDHFPAQLEAFTPLARELKEAYPHLMVHAANSAATLREPAAHFDLVRCGIAVYGLDPFGQDPAERGLEPALRLESYVAAVKRFEPGQSAGYGRRWTADGADLGRDDPDRLRRRLAARAHEQRRRPGRRPPLPDRRHRLDGQHHGRPRARRPTWSPERRAVLIGEQDGERILAEEVARRLDTINYEVTCGLTPRVRRLHEHL